MNFTEYLNLVYSKLDCTQAELCNATNISAPVISRYLSGAREPSADSEQIKLLAKGIHEIAISKNLTSTEFEYDNLLLELTNSVLQKKIIYASFVSNFDTIVDKLNINMKDLAKTLNFDVSYLYRIKSGERHPIDLDYFCESVADYIISNTNSPDYIKIVAKLFECDAEKITDHKFYKDKILDFLKKAAPFDDDIPDMSAFLSKMEDFNLEEYIKVIHFDELKIPNIPFQLPSSKYYYGLEDMRKAELDFLKATVLGKSKDPVFMCSFMPMQEMAEDMDFGKKWMFGIAMMIKKGLHLNVIHNLNRPMHELMLGFEAWIPIYMTGQVSPFHITGDIGEIFHQINYCSGSAALTGECIDSYYEDGRYYVTNNKSELSYFKKKAKSLLNTAVPLMDIYTKNEKDKFNAFLKKEMHNKGNRRIIASSLPIFTIPDSIINNHFSNLDLQNKNEIISYINDLKSYMENVHDNIISYDISTLTKEEYNKNPATISFPNIFCDYEFELSYEEYILHLASTKEYAKNHKNFNLNLVDTNPFKNIEITIVSGKYFMISKSKSPNIHFVIYHKKMLAGIENFYTAYKE